MERSLGMYVKDLVPRTGDTVIVQELQGVFFIPGRSARRQYKLGPAGGNPERPVITPSENNIDCSRRCSESRKLKQTNLLRDDSLEMPFVLSENVIETNELVFYDIITFFCFGCCIYCSVLQVRCFRCFVFSGLEFGTP